MAGGPGDDLTFLAELGEPSRLPAASSLLSSRWSEDNLVTCHPRKLYTGAPRARIDDAALADLLREVERSTGPLEPLSVHMGVCTWDVACDSGQGPLTVQFPALLDEAGERGRSVSEVPRRNAANMRHFIERGLERFVVAPQRELTLNGAVPAAVFSRVSEHRAITFGRGRVQIDMSDGELDASLALGPHATAEILTEMVAALAYHYEPDTAGGTAITDVFVNDADFVVKRRADGGFDLRLTAVRWREPGIAPSALLLYLIQLNAFEDWEIDGALSGLPALISNPSIAFEGLLRGLRYRCGDQGRPVEEGTRLGRQWIEQFSRSRFGRAYRPWVERFLEGRLAPEFGQDLREHWWRLLPLRQKQSIRDLSASASGDAGALAAAAAMKALCDGLSQQIGDVPETSPEGLRINDLDRAQLGALLAGSALPTEARDSVAAGFFSAWPYRSFQHLFDRVPAAKGLQTLPLDFGAVVSGDDEGTLRSLPRRGPGERQRRTLANAETFDAFRVPEALQEGAVRAFLTFERYMDSALHDAEWGYYATSVVIGKDGHFNTHPEILSPWYGRWLAQAAFHGWQQLCSHGDLAEFARFTLIEFGAGNGRLARDFLDAVDQRATTGASEERSAWQRFQARLEYRIYELSPTLREKQRALLGDRAVISAGDARRPRATLARDFPEGLRGLVVTNEVPDAFGVHKVLLTREGVALAALVVPRVEPELRRELADELARRVADSDVRLRARFGFRARPADAYLDVETYLRLMTEMAAFSAENREVLLGGLRFEEAYVPAACVPELSQHLREHATHYASALAAEDSGVVAYVNVHATRFIDELARSLLAGSIVTIDYGDTTFGLIQGARRGDFPFRVYRDGEPFVPRPNDPYSTPGMQDMTADVNFSELASAGCRAGLVVQHYGHERDLAGNDMPSLLRAAASPGIAAFLGANVFRLLVLGTRPNAVFHGPLTTPLPLERDPAELPPSRRELAERILRNLAGAA